MSPSIPLESVVQGRPVALRLHVRLLEKVLVIFNVVPPRRLVEKHGIPEIVQCHVLDPAVVAIVPVYVLRMANVVMLSVVGGRQQLHPVSHELAVELHQQAHESKVVGRDLAFESPVVGVSVGGVPCGQIPGVISVYGHQGLVFVGLVELLQDFSEGAGCYFWLCNASIY